MAFSPILAILLLDGIDDIHMSKMTLWFSITIWQQIVFLLPIWAILLIPRSGFIRFMTIAVDIGYEYVYTSHATSVLILYYEGIFYIFAV